MLSSVSLQQKRKQQISIFLLCKNYFPCSWFEMFLSFTWINSKNFSDLGHTGVLYIMKKVAHPSDLLGVPFHFHFPISHPHPHAQSQSHSQLLDN